MFGWLLIALWKYFNIDGVYNWGINIETPLNFLQVLLYRGNLDVVNAVTLIFNVGDRISLNFRVSFGCIFYNSSYFGSWLQHRIFNGYMGGRFAI